MCLLGFNHTNIQEVTDLHTFLYTKTTKQRSCHNIENISARNKLGKIFAKVDKKKYFDKSVDV